MEDKITKYREYFPVTKNYIYLNHAATSPLNVYSLEKAQSYLNLVKEEGDVSWSYLQSISETARFQVSQLLECEPSEVAFIQNTSIGINILVESIEWQENDEVLILENSFPALEYPFKYNRYNLKIKKVNFAEIEKYITPKTRLVALEWVNYFTGEKIGLNFIKELKNRYDLFVLLDAIQGLGAFPLSPREYDIDFVVAGTSKWLLGPQGLGILYVSRKAFSKLKTGFIGWLSCPWRSFADFSNLPDPFSDARVFETGTKNYFGISYLTGNLDMILDLGIQNVSQKIQSFIDLMFNELCDVAEVVTPYEKKSRAGIFTFKIRAMKAEDLYNKLTDLKIRVSLRNGFIRVSPHFYNTEEEIENFIRKVKEV